MISNPRHDIIQKLLADLARVFAELMGFDTTESLAQLQKYYKEWLGLKKEELAEISPDDLLQYLLEEKKFLPEQLELLAQLLGKEGEILMQNQQISSGKDQIQKALVIFGYVEEHSQTFSFERRQTFKQLKELLSNN